MSIDAHNSIAIAVVNSDAPLPTNSPTIYPVLMGEMGVMGLKRRPLDADQLADARRLEAAWQAFKRKRPEATQQWVAQQLGWKTQAAAHQYIAGKIPLNLDALLKFSGLFGVEPDRISPTLALKLPLAVNDAQPSYVYFTKCDVRFAAGTGTFAFVNQAREKSHAFRREWVVRRRFREDKMVILDVVGDSMYPLIRDGDVVCVNTADREPKSGEIYAIATADGPRVKYLYKRESDGKWELRSENPSPRYAPEELTEAHQVAIVGRVVWRAGDV